MADKTEQVSLWSTFDNLVNDAEKQFFAHDFKAALKLWLEYARITGAPNWMHIFEELNYLVQEYLSANLKESQELFEEWLRLRNKLKNSQ